MYSTCIGGVDAVIALSTTSVIPAKKGCYRTCTCRQYVPHTVLLHSNKCWSCTVRSAHQPIWGSNNLELSIYDRTCTVSRHFEICPLPGASRGKSGLIFNWRPCDCSTASLWWSQLASSTAATAPKSTRTFRCHRIQYSTLRP